MTSSFGLGLRTQHYTDFLTAPQPVDWLEVISDNYMVKGGKPLAVLEQIRNDYPIVMHGVSMSLGSVEGLDREYLNKLKTLADRFQPMWISDHLCWTGVHGRQMHDLLPLPFTEEAFEVVRRNIEHAQDVLQRPLVVENVSSYVEFSSSEMTEWAFLARLSEATGCKLLVDLNNIFVSAFNHGFSADAFLDGIAPDSVQQFHLAGHQNNGSCLIDTHDHPVCDGVWDLYRRALQRFGPVPTMIERDDLIPPLSDLLDELQIARDIAHDTLNAKVAV